MSSSCNVGHGAVAVSSDVIEAASVLDDEVWLISFHFIKLFIVFLF